MPGSHVWNNKRRTIRTIKFLVEPGARAALARLHRAGLAYETNIDEPRHNGIGYRAMRFIKIIVPIDFAMPERAKPPAKRKPKAPARNPKLARAYRAEAARLELAVAQHESLFATLH